LGDGIETFSGDGVRRGREGLPVGHDFAGIFKLAAEEAASELRCEDFAEAEAGGGEVEVGTIADTGASLEEGTVLPWELGERRSGGVVCIGGWRLGYEGNPGHEAEGDEKSKRT
jgi:hypothetical protein